MRIVDIEGVLNYLIFHRCSENCTMDFDSNDLNRCAQDIYRGVQIRIEYVDNAKNIPEGLYIIECIPVD
jgi:hypothetical protein